VTSQEFQI